MNKLIVFFFKLINYLFPKSKNDIFLMSSSFEEGNMWLLLKELEKRSSAITCFSTKTNYSIPQKIYFLIKFYRSSIIFSTHGTISFKIRRQCMISIWHGIPIKDIRNTSFKRTLDFQVSNSFFTEMIFSNVWNLNNNKFLRFGEPIFDFFNSPYKYLTTQEKKYITSLADLKPVVLFCPTYRKSKYSVEGSLIQEIILSFVEVVKNLPQFHFIISLHPEEYKTLDLELFMQSNLSFSKISSEKLLPFSDLVITDVSSLLYYSIYLKKKTLVYFPDFEKYIEKRKLLFSDFEIFPKSLFFTKPSEIINFLKKNFDFEIRELEYINNLIFPKKLKDCSKRLLDYFNID